MTQGIYNLGIKVKICAFHYKPSLHFSSLINSTKGKGPVSELLQKNPCDSEYAWHYELCHACTTVVFVLCFSPLLCRKDELKYAQERISRCKPHFVCHSCFCCSQQSQLLCCQFFEEEKVSYILFLLMTHNQCENLVLQSEGTDQ